MRGSGRHFPFEVILGPAVLAFLIPGCGQSACPDGPRISNTLATAERWVRVSSIAGRPASEGTHEVEMDVATITPDGEAPVQSEAVLIHSDFVDELEGALDDGSDAFIALTQHPGRPNEEIASYVLVRDEDGAHHLPGIGCDSEDFLRERMGTHYDETLDSIIGVTSRKQIKQALLAQGLG
jgi:hypothetical protein